MLSYLSIAILLNSEPPPQAVLDQLGSDRYRVIPLKSMAEFRNVVEQEKQHLDCLVLQMNSELPHLVNWLHGQAVLLPAVFVGTRPDSNSKSDRGGNGEGDRQAVSAANPPRPDVTTPPLQVSFIYHTAEIWLDPVDLDQPDQLGYAIDQAITQFIDLSPTCRLKSEASSIDLEKDLTTQNFLMLQQRRLTEKLKERLGYLGVYYKRNPQNFFRHLPPEQKQELTEQLKNGYREIILHYFDKDGSVNNRIDDFVNAVFFADIAVFQVVEIHMDLMDEFSKQLQLEGRSDEILLDYRLTLIDTIAHLCEMYRRSIPRVA